jgi:hypothetical protein
VEHLKDLKHINMEIEQDKDQEISLFKSKFNKNNLSNSDERHNIQFDNILYYISNIDDEHSSRVARISLIILLLKPVGHVSRDVQKIIEYLGGHLVRSLVIKCQVNNSPFRLKIS